MSDAADMAEVIEQIKRDDALAYRKEAGPAPCGRCHFCDAPVAPGLPFCDSECRDDWQKHMDALRRNRGTM